MKRRSSGGGWQALAYAWRTARRVGGVRRLYRALRRPNACKTCALGMGGQRGGMVNELGQFPEVCKKSMQAMAADMQGAIPREFFATWSIDQLRTLTPYDLEHAGRLATPLLAGAGDTHYRPITWDEALDFCARRLKAVQPDETFFYFSGRASNEAAFLWQLFARLYGTNNVNNCSYYCHQASGAGLTSVVGSGTATVVLEDLRRCDLVLLIGGNPASNHPRMMTLLADVRRRGGHVIVINPLREPGLVNFRIPSRPLSLLFGSPIASLYVQPNIGGDIALLTGVAKRLDEQAGSQPQMRGSSPRPQAPARGSSPRGDVAAWARDFLESATEGYEDFIAHVRATPWDRITRDAGVDRATIDRVADLYAASRATIFAWTMGITHHAHGVDNVRAIANLALLRGMVGRPGAGLLPIRGHSNVQGVGSVGVTPQLKQAIFDRLESHFGVKLPTTPGMDTLACMRAMSEGRLRNAFCLGGNLFGSNPDARQAAADFARLDACVYLSTTLNTGHAWGRARETLILPVLARDEEAQATTQESMFNYVRLSDGGPRRLDGPRSEVEIVADIAERVLCDVPALSTQPDVAQPDSVAPPPAASVAQPPSPNVAQPPSPNVAQPPSAHVAQPPSAVQRPAALRAAAPGACNDSPDAHEPHAQATPALPLDWRALRQHRNIRTAIAQIIPGFETIGQIDDTRREFQIAGRTFHEPRFATPTGKARFHAVPLPDLSLADGELRLMTIRSEGQFNTVVYEQEDIYRNQERRDVILMNPADIDRLGLRVDQPARVQSPAGAIDVLVRAWDVPCGNAAMYYPEANLLVPRLADAVSRTPAFKSVRVRVQPAANVSLPLRDTAARRSRPRRGADRPLRAC